MEDLKVIGVEDGTVIAESGSGDRYRIEIDDALAAQIRHAVRDTGSSRKLAPKDIQAHIRSGMSAQDVASITGTPLEYIQRFEGPILAERQFVIDSALAVPVHTAKDTELGENNATFGSAILSRLHELSATGERWASWKEETHGWVVKLTFAADQVDHDARWRFDPKKTSLAPINNEAETLSRQGELTGTLIPRLRAVDGNERQSDTSRFDSGAFVDQELAGIHTPPSLGTVENYSGTTGTYAADEIAKDATHGDTAPHLEAVPFGRSTKIGEPTQPRVDQAPSNQTADLLEALRRRRGERESANFDEVDDARADHPSTGSIRLVSVPEPQPDEDSTTIATSPASVRQSSPKSTKRGRASMPSWDEIVFGARSDDDPA